LKRPFRLESIIPPINEKAIINDFTSSSEFKADDVSDISRDEILKRIRKNEVFGFGGAAFPTYKKIMTLIESDAVQKHLIINGVECDPGLIHDKWILHKYPDEIYKGIEILKKCDEFKSTTIAVKDIRGLSYPGDCKIFKADDYYPAGAEKVLIKNVLGKTLSHEDIPAMEGILVLNIQTVFSIYEAVCKNKKADSRFITVADVREKTGQVVRVKLGSNIHEIIEKIYQKPVCIFSGGGLMQSRTAVDDDIVDKSVNFIAVGELPRYKESPLCSKCALCVTNCPAGLKVNTTAHLVDDKNLKETEKFHAEKRMRCGLCSFVCLAGRNLSSRVKTAAEFLDSVH
jgi:Na+-translocating ferredoxin:NAD+ oxidoreductase RnfC subunit